MPAKGRKGTLGRKKSWEFVVSAIERHGGEVAERLIEILLQHLLEGEEMPDVHLFFTLLGRRMTSFGTAMVEASESHLDELADDEALRLERDETTRTLADDYIAMRDGYRTGYGPNFTAAVGFERNVATDPAESELQVARLCTNLGKPELVVPASRYPGIAPQPADTVALFRPRLDRLKAIRTTLNRAYRDADGSQLAKNDAVAAHDREFPVLSRCFESCCTVAGRDDLAQRVRPSLRRPGRRKEEVDAEAAAADAEEGPPEETASGEVPPGDEPSAGGPSAAADEDPAGD